MAPPVSFPWNFDFAVENTELTSKKIIEVLLVVVVTLYWNLKQLHQPEPGQTGAIIPRYGF